MGLPLGKTRTRKALCETEIPSLAERTMIIAGTGHRPDKIRLGNLDGYRASVQARLVDLARAALDRHVPERVISGMALGWDTALAQAALDLGIPFDAYVPFEGQESRWPAAAQQRYRDLLGRADQILIVSPGSYEVEKMQVRNERMVDDCDLLLALWNGTAGGTRNCLRYAGKVGRRVVNLWPHWARHAAGRTAGAPDPVLSGLLAAAGALA
jgi:uncharacterized phage-like protein YoqJ